MPSLAANDRNVLVKAKILITLLIHFFYFYRAQIGAFMMSLGSTVQVIQGDTKIWRKMDFRHAGKHPQVNQSNSTQWKTSKVGRT